MVYTLRQFNSHFCLLFFEYLTVHPRSIFFSAKEMMRLSRLVGAPFLSLLVIFLLFSLVGCQAPAADLSDPAEAVAVQPAVSESGWGGALNGVDEDYLLSQVTRVPTLLELPTLTMIPTVTPRSDQDGGVVVENGPGLEEEEIEVPLPTVTSISMTDAVLSLFRPSTRVPTPQPDEAEKNVPAPNIITDVKPTPALPDLPSILPTPEISQTIRVPILMYHYVSTPPEDADKYRVNLSVEPDNFRQQMAYLHDNGVEVIDLYELTEYLVKSETPPDNAVILTFDDGYVDNYQFAYPILEEFGYKGTFFIVTEFVDRGFPQYMSWEMIEEMAAAGHRFESHTKTHPDLAILGYNDLVWQILGSQETLAAHLGYKPQYLSYPSGSYNEETLQMVESLSLWGAVTTKGGMWRGHHDRFEWTRTRISYGTTLEDLKKVVRPKERDE